MVSSLLDSCGARYHNILASSTITLQPDDDVVLHHILPYFHGTRMVPNCYTCGQKSGILLFVQRSSHILTSSSKGRFKKMPNVYFINVWHDMQNIFDISNVL